MRRTTAALAGALALLLVAAALPCSAQSSLILATTTSTQDTGLLDDLLPRFEAATGSRSRRSPSARARRSQWAAAATPTCCSCTRGRPRTSSWPRGSGRSRLDVMHNDFVLVGPPVRPRRGRRGKPSVDAFKRIAEKGAPFASRDDRSGTHEKELDLWKKAGVDPAGKPGTSPPARGWARRRGSRPRSGPTRSPTAARCSPLRKTLELAILVEEEPGALQPLPRHRRQPGEAPEGAREGGRSTFAEWLVIPDGAGAHRRVRRREVRPAAVRPRREVARPARALRLPHVRRCSRCAGELAGILAALALRLGRRHPRLDAPRRPGRDLPRPAPLPRAELPRHARQHRHGPAARSSSGSASSCSSPARAARRARPALHAVRRWSSRRSSSPCRWSSASRSPPSRGSTSASTCRSSRSAPRRGQLYLEARQGGAPVARRGPRRRLRLDHLRGRRRDDGRRQHPGADARHDDGDRARDAAGEVRQWRSSSARSCCRSRSASTGSSPGCSRGAA